MKEFECTECDKRFGSKEAFEMHNKSKHKEKYKAPLLSKRQKSNVLKYGIMLLALIFVVGFFIWRAVPPKDAPMIEIRPDFYSFGSVSQARGEVSTMMDITNLGNRDLIITGMDTSCGCTSAAMMDDGVEGPRFSMAMHGTNPSDWEQVIAPGESAKLKVYYDPNVHKDMRGAVTRSVYISSNDPRHSKEEVRISAVQVD